MGIHPLVATWLAQSSFAAGGPLLPDADGSCSLSYGSIAMTLAVPEGEDFFVLHAPLMSVSGGSTASLVSFFQELLALQLYGELPPGMAFGMEPDDTLVSLVGQYRTQGLDPTSFDALLREALAGAEALRGRLESRFTELLEAEEQKTGAMQTPPAARTDTSHTEARLTDRELLHIRMMQGIRF